jgi:hypothetical protein
MSSPIHRVKNLDAALKYAPPWARDPERSTSMVPAAAPGNRPSARRLGGGSETFSGDRAMQALQRQLALNPEKIPQPPIADAQSLWPFAFRLGAVVAAAAIAAWGLVLLSGANQVGSETVQADAPPTEQPAAPAVKRVKLIQVRSADETAPAAQEQLAAQQQPTAPMQNLSIGPPQPPPIASQPAASQSASGTVVLDRDEIAMLVKRGKDFLSEGDLASARLLLRRAAEAGSAEAALALGASFDPIVIERLGAVGVQPDAARARKWYQTAATLGSEAASQQLATLAQSGQ